MKSWQRISIHALVILAWLAYSFVIYFAWHAPSMPYLKQSLFRIDRLTRPADGGALQEQDLIGSIDGKPFYRCMYLWAYTPVFAAPRNVPITMEYLRDDGSGENFEPGTTSIVLRDASNGELVQRVLIYGLAFTFLLVGTVVVVGGGQGWVGFVGIIAALIIAAGPDVSDFQAPWSVFYWLGTPVWGLIAVVAHSRWPVNQMKTAYASWIVGIYAILAATLIFLTLSGMAEVGCFAQDGLIYKTWSRLFSIVQMLPLPILLFLLAAALRRAQSPIARSQIRAIMWSVGLGLGAPVLLSLLPASLGLRWAAPPELTLLGSIIIPVAYAYVAYQATLLKIERFISQTVVGFLVTTGWGIITIAIVNIMLYWNPDPSPLALAVVPMIPLVLIMTVLKAPLGSLVDLALYGKSYDYETVVTDLVRMFTSPKGISQRESIVQGLVEHLPETLGAEAAALWLQNPTKQNSLVLAGARGAGGAVLPPVLSGKPLGDMKKLLLDTVTLLDTPCTLAGSEWHVGINLSGTHTEGILLLGKKMNRRVYGDKDWRVLVSVANWAAANLTIQRLAEIEAASERDRMRLLLEHEENVLQEVASVVHDEGITGLGYLQTLIKLDESQDTLLKAVDRVILDLRKISKQRLYPEGLEQGLVGALAAMKEDMQRMGWKIDVIEDPECLAEWNKLKGGISREMYYVVREAVTNAIKHGKPPVEIYLSCDRQENALLLRVIDHGKGFPPAYQQDKALLHRGLAIMQARVNRMGGVLKLNRIEKGMEVAIWLSSDPQETT